MNLHALSAVRSGRLEVAGLNATEVEGLVRRTIEEDLAETA